MGVGDRIEQWANSQYGSVIAQLKQWLEENTHHGCFCGAGSDCDQPVDGLDSCCKAHDSDYGSAGVSFATMWEIPAGFTKARDADAGLAQCAGSAQTDVDHYRVGLKWVFETRVAIADALLRWQRFRDWLLTEAPSQTVEDRQAQYAYYAADLSALGGVSNDDLAGALADHGVDLTHNPGSTDYIA